MVGWFLVPCGMNPKGSSLEFSKHVTESFLSEEPKPRQYDDATLQSIDPFSELSQLMFDNDYNTFVSILKNFLEVDEILGSVVVRRQIQPIDAKAPSFPAVIKKK